MGEWQPVLGEHGDVFDQLAANTQQFLDCEARELELIAAAAEAYHTDHTSAGAACEKLIRGGADGTPLVGEFLALELAGILRISPTAAALRVAAVLNLKHRHPRLWNQLHTGRVRAWQALKVAEQCAAAGLDLAGARWVDAQLCATLAVQGWPRTQRRLEGLIVQADPAIAAERAEAQRQARSVRVGDHTDGGSVLYARLDTAEAVALDHTIGRVTDALARAGNTDPADQRRAAALGVLADPAAAQALLDGTGDGTPSNRAAQLVIHIAADTVYPDWDCRLYPAPWNTSGPAGQATAGARADGRRVGAANKGSPGDVGGKPDAGVVPRIRGDRLPAPESLAPRPGLEWTDWHRTHTPAVARIEGIGPIDLDTLKRFLGHADVVCRQVVDLNVIPATDSYETPARLRQALLARNPVEVFPYSNRTNDRADLDHTIPYDRTAPAGALQTRIENLGPLTRTPHRAKTARHWQVVQNVPGEYLWTSPLGYRYLVTDDAPPHSAANDVVEAHNGTGPTPSSATTACTGPSHRWSTPPPAGNQTFRPPTRHPSDSTATTPTLWQGPVVAATLLCLLQRSAGCAAPSGHSTNGQLGVQLGKYGGIGRPHHVSPSPLG